MPPRNAVTLPRPLQSRRLDIRLRSAKGPAGETKKARARAGAGAARAPQLACSQTTRSRHWKHLFQPATRSRTLQEFVHMLNGTLSATARTLCCLLENHQTPDGVR